MAAVAAEAEIIVFPILQEEMEEEEDLEALVITFNLYQGEHLITILLEIQETVEIKVKPVKLVVLLILLI
ncbi:MAG: hypothetical protein CME98_24135 [Hyphomonas sp.]|nr:hypothetical protein [Hyphomonas sp.]